MTTVPKLSSKGGKQKRYNLWFERVMAILALLNLILVLFNITYIPLRRFYLLGRVKIIPSFSVGPWEFEGLPPKPIKLNFLSGIVELYDPIKAIEPYRDTQQYLETAEELQESVIEYSLRSPQVEALLAELREQSVEMIETNPFEISNQTGTLERLKNKMRLYMFGTVESSAKEAFREFWTIENFDDGEYNEDITFFNQEIAPLIGVNYYRPIGETCEFVDNFGILDFPFFIIFLTEFIARTWYISRRHVGVSWFDAMLWRWYDIFLLIPVFRWLRVIPVVIRLHQADLINLEKIQKQASQGFVAGIAQDVTEVVIIRFINQIQGTIQRGEIGTLLSQSSQREYIDINEVNETAELTKLFTKLAVNKVIPEVKPDIEALLYYNINKAIQDIPIYSQFKQFPGVEQLKTTLTEELTKRIYQITYDLLQGAIQEDPEFDKLMDQLVTHLTEALSNEVQAQKTLDRIEFLLTDLLEEVKINYVERLSEEDVEEVLDQTRALRQVAHTPTQPTRPLPIRRV
ncbi:MAG: hypothetical protein ACOC0N_03875 [Chroococcales cyanobacterium]